tara:strand:- start:854 stop:1408 length:555 start_codon:yes stop_codon:yes gene_type:complete
MKQKFIIVDDFYESAHHIGGEIDVDFYQSKFKDNALHELNDKISIILNRNVQVKHVFNEVSYENSHNPIVANTACDWIGVVYHNLPTETNHLGRGVSFYIHNATKLDCFPDKLACEINGLQNDSDIVKCFNTSDRSYWKEYINIFIKYNRLVLFRADLWHSYGMGFGNELNNSMKYQKVLIKND